MIFLSRVLLRMYCSRVYVTQVYLSLIIKISLSVSISEYVLKLLKGYPRGWGHLLKCYLLFGVKPMSILM